MKSRVFVFVVAASLLFIMALYFLINPSYEKSLRAKYYYETGKYAEAYNLAKEAFDIDVYNRMAATVMAQSQTSLKYKNYIDDAKKYMKGIDEIAKHKQISDADKAKIKMMCNIMLGSYVKLAPSVITDEELVQEAAAYHAKFEKLLEKVTKN
jgi:tetratricopeptide (TPR) repeat protein